MFIRFPIHIMLLHLALIFTAVTATPLNHLPAQHDSYHDRSISLQRRAPLIKPAPGGKTPIVIKTAADAAPYVKTPAPGKAMLWSGIQFDKAQAFSKAHGYQTLEQSVGSEILTHPDAHDTKRWVAFWAALSEAFANKVATSSREVTIVLRAPNKKLTGPSNPLEDGRLYAASDAGKIEIPRMKQAGVKIYAIHPDVPGAAGSDRYQLWPNDEGYKWQQKHQIGAKPGLKARAEGDLVSVQKRSQIRTNAARAVAIKKRLDLDGELDLLLTRRSLGRMLLMTS